MREKIAAGNWKMNLTLQEAQGLCSEIINIHKDEFLNGPRLILAPPFPYLSSLAGLLKAHVRISLSGQNVSAEKRGAFTGEVSAEMLASIGCTYCIIGHSERRNVFAETNALILRKAQILIENKIKPIFCLGESETEREMNQTLSVIEKQLSEGLFPIGKNAIQECVIAYEPVWAIGTGKNASPGQAGEVHDFIRNLLEKNFGTQISDSISILYGGSVNAENASDLFQIPNIDGGLIGGASLKSRDFITIAKALPL